MAIVHLRKRKTQEPFFKGTLIDNGERTQIVRSAAIFLSHAKKKKGMAYNEESNRLKNTQAIGRRRAQQVKKLGKGVYEVTFRKRTCSTLSKTDDDSLFHIFYSHSAEL